MLTNLGSRDFKVIAGIVSVFAAGAVLRLLLGGTFTLPSEMLLLTVELLSAFLLLYGIRSGRRKWSGELGRLIDILSVAVVVILVMQALSALLHFTPSTPILGISDTLWEEMIAAGNSIGMLIAAYGFYEFSNAPWFHERGGGVTARRATLVQGNAARADPAGMPCP